MKLSSLATAALVAALVAPSADAQATYKRELPDSLVKKAKITEADVAGVAQKRVPKGTIENVELEREDGKLLYSYILKTAGKSGVDEVNVDAMTAKIIAVEHESPAPVKKEADAEAKEKAKAAPAKPKKP